MTDIQKQLIAKLGEEFTNIFPLQYVSNILDKATGETLTILLSRCNHVFIPFTGDKNVTRAAVPHILRRKGLYITYITINSEIVTEYFKGNKTQTSDEYWTKDEYWGTNLTSDNFVPITLPDGSITADKLSQEVLDLIGQGFKGNIENQSGNVISCRVYGTSTATITNHSIVPDTMNIAATIKALWQPGGASIYTNLVQSKDINELLVSIENGKTVDFMLTFFSINLK